MLQFGNWIEVTKGQQLSIVWPETILQGLDVVLSRYVSPRKAKTLLKLAEVLFNYKSSVFHVHPCSHLVETTSSVPPIPGFLLSFLKGLPVLERFVWVLFGQFLPRTVSFFFKRDL